MKYSYILIFLIISTLSFGQGNSFTLDDAILSTAKGMQPTRLANVQWAGSSDAYSYLKEDQLVIVNREDKGESTITATELNPDFTSFPSVKWLNKESFRYKDGAAYMSYNIEDKKVSRIISHPQEATNLTLNMECQCVAYTIDNDLFVSTQKGFNTPIAKNNDPNIVSGQAIARSEFGIHNGIFWSKNGKYIAFYEKDESNVWDYPLLDMTTTPGALKSIKYPMAGQKSEISTVGIFNVDKNKLVYLQNSKMDDHYYTNVTFSPNGASLIVTEVNRAQNHIFINKYKSSNGEFVETLYEESNDKWVEPEHPIYFLDNNLFLNISEKNGFMDVYRYRKDGFKEKQITKDNGEIHNIIGHSENLKYIFVAGTGPDPKQRHVFKVKVSNGKMTQLTNADGSHSSSLSPDGGFLLDSYSSLDTPFKIDIINIDKGNTETIYEAPNPLTDYTIGTLDFIKVPVDGYDLHARMVKPSNFDPNKKYPVLVYVYGGPHAQMVTNRWGGGAAMWMRWMAEQGYLVFTLDNRGSANLGFEMESQIHRQVGTVEMQDQMIGVDYLKSLPYVDGDRLAVHGWSYGGFMTMSLMLRQAGTFNVGVAGGPVVDWKWYEAMYGERYMDTPEENPEGYAANSLMNHVEKLEGKLLTIHGAVDDVVLMQHNYGFHRACIEKGVQADFYAYPTHPHNVRGKDRIHLMTKVLNYVMDHNK